MSCSIAHPISKDFGILYTKSELSFAEDVLCFVNKLDYGFEQESDLIKLIQQQESLFIFTYQNVYCVASDITQSVLHRIFNITSSNTDMSIIVTDPFGQVQLNLCQNCNDCSDGTPGDGFTPIACADIGADTFTITPIYVTTYLNGITVVLNTGNSVTNWPEQIIARFNNLTYRFLHAGNGTYYIEGTAYEVTTEVEWTFYISEIVIDYSCTRTFEKEVTIVIE